MHIAELVSPIVRINPPIKTKLMPEPIKSIKTGLLRLIILSLRFQNIKNMQPKATNNKAIKTPKNTAASASDSVGIWGTIAKN